MGVYTNQTPEKSTPEGIAFRIEGKRPSTIPLFILGLLTCLFLLFPFGVLILLTSEGAFHPKYLFGIALASIPGVYFSRVFLWNRYGAEVLTITENGVHLWNDYRLFKGNNRFLKGENVCYLMVPQEAIIRNLSSEMLDELMEKDLPQGKLLLSNEAGEKINTFQAVSTAEWESVLEKVNAQQALYIQLVPMKHADSDN